MCSERCDPGAAGNPFSRDYRKKYLHKDDAYLSVPTPFERLATRFNSAILKARLPAGSSVLDVGCNKGFLLAALPGHRRVGMDLSFGFRSPGATYVIGDAEALPFRAGGLDAVVLAEVVEHLPDCQACYLEVRRVLRQGGLILLTHPNKENPLQQTIEAVKENRWVRRVLGRSLYVGDQHMREYSFRDTRGELEALGMTLLDCRTPSLGLTRFLSPLIYGRFRCERLFPLITKLGELEAKIALSIGRFSLALPGDYAMLFRKGSLLSGAGDEPASGGSQRKTT